MKKKNICVFGDSLVYGLRDSMGGGWVSRLQNILGNDFMLWNYGIPGDHSLDLAKRVNEECTEKIPDIAICMIGANDSQYIANKNNTLISLEDFKKNLKIIYKSIKQFTPHIIFVGLIKMDESITTNWNFKGYFCNENLTKYDIEIKNFCEKNSVRYIHILNLLNKKDLSDGAHPNSNGYQKIADKINLFLVENKII